MMCYTAALLALLCCAAPAVLAGQTPACDANCGDCDCQVIFNAASVTTMSNDYFGASTNIAVRPCEGNTSLSWNIDLLKNLDASGLTMTLEVYQQINTCWVQVWQGCDISTCDSPDGDMADKFTILLGRLNSEPRVLSCPIKKNTYKLKNYTSPLIKLGIGPGKTLVKYFYKDHGKPIINFSLWVDIVCVNN